MSDVISAWVDEDEMRRLAASLLSRPYGHEFNHLEVNFGSQFEGFANGVSAAPAMAASAEAQGSSAGQKNAGEAASAATPVAPAAVALEPPEESQELSSISDSSGSVASEASAAGPVPSVVRSAVQFLKKAQTEGRAGGVIREAREEPTRPSPPPSESMGVSYPEPSKPEPRPIYSPFRRVSEVEVEAVPEAVEEAPPEPATQSSPQGQAPGQAQPSPNFLKRPPVPSGDEPILARVVQYGKWLKGPLGVRNFFVSNMEGKILIDEVANPKLIEVARSLAEASGSSDNEVGSLHVRIGEDSILEVVPTPSQFGTLILGLIVEHSLPGDLIREIRLGLEEVANARLIKSS